MAVAPPLIRRLGWPLAAAAAFAFLVGLALQGERRDPMQDFKPAGLLTAFAPEDAREIEIGTGAEVWLFRRDGAWGSVEPAKPLPADFAQRIETALRLLRNSAPLRVLTAEEVARVPPSEYALTADSMRVQVGAADGATFRVQFGGLNPQGSARYAKVDGMEGVPMLPAYVGDAWEQVIGGPRR
jgi:hypothetical protein